jgi:predicted RNA-binding protein with PUA-like domain
LSYYIFQGSPDVFEVNDYIDSAVENDQKIHWNVSRYREDIQVGDKVFLWRSIGRAPEKSGVVGYAVVTSPPEPDPANEAAYRAELVVVASNTQPKQLVKRDWMQEDPILCDLGILANAQGSNFRVTPEQGRRLHQLTSNTGVPWNKPETIAGLWLYNELGDGSISKGKDSEVARVASQIGRAVTGVYNKVMNFRAIDPRDARAGMTGGGQMAREVWNAYYDAASKTLDVDVLERDYRRLWHTQTNAVTNLKGEEVPAAPVEASDDDIADKRLVSITRRRGQPAFRKRLLHLYDGKCAISGVDIDLVLDAAHIVNHAESGVNHSDNGILLRSDLHDLFDAGLIVINPEDYTLAVDGSLSESIYYQYQGKAIAPRTDGSQPSSDYILQKNRSGG